MKSWRVSFNDIACIYNVFPERGTPPPPIAALVSNTALGNAKISIAAALPQHDKGNASGSRK